MSANNNRHAASGPARSGWLQGLAHRGEWAGMSNAERGQSAADWERAGLCLSRLIHKHVGPTGRVYSPRRSICCEHPRRHASLQWDGNGAFGNGAKVIWPMLIFVALCGVGLRWRTERLTSRAAIVMPFADAVRDPSSRPIRSSIAGRRCSGSRDPCGGRVEGTPESVRRCGEGPAWGPHGSRRMAFNNDPTARSGAHQNVGADCTELSSALLTFLQDCCSDLRGGGEVGMNRLNQAKG